MNLKILLSTLMVYHSNFKVLHWKAEGGKFLAIHEKADEYCNYILEDIDKVGEMILRTDDNIVNYIEALDIIKEIEDHTFLILDSNKSYDIDKFCNNSIKMFNDILYCIEEILDDGVRNIGIKAELEGLYEKYDLEANYILKRLNK